MIEEPMSDSAILDALERGDVRPRDLDFYRGEWWWYDWRGWPSHSGWKRAKSFRQAASELALRRGEGRPDCLPNTVILSRDA
jgi:hypothetical protein